VVLNFHYALVIPLIYLDTLSFLLGIDKTLINKVQDPFYLTQIAQTYKDVSKAVDGFGPWAVAWVGEAGGAYNSGGRDVSHTFANGFWYSSDSHKL